jgi:hypothetical protein
MTTFTKKTILDFCNISSLSYCNQDEMTQQYNDCSCEVLSRCKTCPTLLESYENDCEVYITKYKSDADNLDCLLVSFRGTSEIRDILSDLNAVRKTMDIIDEKPLVHWGFYNQFLDIKTQLDNEIDKYHMTNENYIPGRTIIFCGHSLGGGLATLASVYYGKKYPHYKIHCVTFGSPRVGGTKFVKIYNNIAEASYRFVNNNDVVTMVPTRMRFVHVKGLRWLTKNNVLTKMGYRLYGSISNTIYNWFGYGGNSSFDDHGCDKYIKNINKNLW